MQKSLQESANFYRSLAMVVGRRESISRADRKTNPFHWVSVAGMLSALRLTTYLPGIREIFFFGQG
jgi:hypothetical protein